MIAELEVEPDIDGSVCYYDPIEHLATILHPLGSKLRLMAALNFNAYIDDSGSHKDSRVFVLGGCIGPASDWSLWYPQWKGLLTNPGNGHRAIEYFHAVEAAHSGGEFRGWNKEESNLFPIRLIPTIEKRRIVKFGVAIVMKDFREIITGKLLEEFKSPYYLCMLSCVALLRGLLKRQDAPRKERIGYIFEEQNEFEAHAKALYSEIKSVKRNERYYKMGPIAFDTKRNAPMLQAADLVAFETYSYMQERMGIRKREYPQRYDLLSSRNFVSKLYSKKDLENLWDKPLDDSLGGQGIKPRDALASGA